MGTTLYLLRQHPDHIASSLFRASDVDMDVIFVEQAASMTPSSVKGVTVGLSRPMMTYDVLVEKIFSSEHIIVL
jgi:hypothetical protein